MRHIVHVIPGIDRIGGAERQMILLADGLARRGRKVSVIALSGDGGDAAAELEAAGVSVLSLGMRKGLADHRGWLRMRRWLRGNTPDVVHAHLPHAVWMARLARLLAPVRVVVDTVHTASTGTASTRFLYRLTASLTDCTTMVSRGAADAHIAAGMVSSRQTTVLPNGIDIGAWHPHAAAGARLREEKGLQDGFLWLAVGRLEPVKDYSALLDAFAGLPQTSRLAIAGVGWLETELRAQCRSLNLDSRVLFLGFTPQVQCWMQAADGFVLASRWEGLPMTLLEAGACALPSVATDVPGSNEIVVNGETGFLTQAGDAESLRRAMLRLMQMAPANRLSMGLNARQRVEQRFSLESVLDRWEELYKVLLHHHPIPTRWGRGF